MTAEQRAFDLDHANADPAVEEIDDQPQLALLVLDDEDDDYDADALRQPSSITVLRVSIGRIGDLARSLVRLVPALPRPGVVAALWVAAGLVGLSLLLLLLGAGAGPAAIALGLGVPIVAAAGGYRAALGRFAHLEDEIWLVRARHDVALEELAACAHELRAPLITARSYFELLADESFGRLPHEAHRATQRGVRALDQAQALTEQALRIGLGEDDLEAGDGDANAGIVRMNALIDEVRLGLDEELQSARATLEVGELPDVAAEREPLYRAFSNLVENGLRYAVPGRRPRIAISGHRQGDVCHFEVRDWGIGVPLGEHDRVFALRYRGPRSQEPGSSLGLSAVQRSVNSQGGRVWIDPMTSGTCVRVLLPAA